MGPPAPDPPTPPRSQPSPQPPPPPHEGAALGGGHQYDEPVCPSGSKADNVVDDDLSDQVLTLAIPERSPLRTTFVGLSAGNDVVPFHSEELHEPLHQSEEGEVLVNGKMESPDSRSKNITAKNLEGNGSYAHVEHRSFGFGTKNQDYNPRKPNLFLFGCFYLEDGAAEVSTSASSSHVNQDTSSMTDAGKTNGGDLLHLMQFVLKENVVDMDGLVICSVLQVLNRIIKDNTDFQENALVLLVSFILAELPVRFPWSWVLRYMIVLEKFVWKQLVLAAALSIQLSEIANVYIACQGIAVLVGFLEADYAKYRFLTDWENSLSCALGAGPLFDVSEESDYVHTLLVSTKL
ncbi:hypothetical protein Vadar_018911 [Vaccinium darrowii]|uniref:Uncharacterized protein n=1 Tax=Vaccinium darrowii TaxID=229202 RepID=A0ACB7ZKD8_9ERIC|nr:hypothetical protein Vadar_018911 [Vaccinium darrowii]